jgi:mannose-6-phosphate isomerase-like protein (cupin superfamily)
MVSLVHTDQVFRVEPNTVPNYETNNTLLRLLGVIQKLQFAAEREHYLSDSLQFLLPYDFLEVFGPSAPQSDVLDPTQQDNKNDFQKQNVRNFRLTDTIVTRGLVTTGNWLGPFLRVSYRGGPDSLLSRLANHQLGDRLKLWIRVGNTATPALINVPYNPRSDRYEIEFWGYPGSNLFDILGDKGKAALTSGELVVRTDLVKGNLNAFNRNSVADLDMRNIDPSNTMHPILPLHLELAWTDQTERFWDSKNGQNYQYEFNMILRGWDNYLKVGVSPNPHGGVGFLEYRNLLSNYFEFANSGELSRQLEWWNLDAFSRKVGQGSRQESFFAVDYMDLHILKSECGIGLHRHRDNQEIFFMINGRGLMVVGDWAKFPNRDRCFEIRTLKAGHFAMLKGGNLHGLMNVTDEDISLFMFGGYD